MKNNTLKLILSLSVFIAGSVSAEQWCNGGTIVDVANVYWSGSTNVAMAGNIPVPPLVSDPDRYQVFTAVSNYCKAYEGGGGPPFMTPVPGSGSVSAVITGPNIYTNTNNDYDLSMGVNFTCEKCYTIPPYKAVYDFELAKPLPGTEGNEKYEQVIQKR